jgi:hypothetical protein
MTTRTIARREAIGRLALGSLGVAAAPVWLEALTARAIEHAEGWSTARAAAAAAWKPKALTAHQAETVATIAELIIPQTETAGARAARVHEFIDEVLYDDEPATRNKFFNGLSWVDQRSRSRYGVDFIKATPDQQVELLTPISRPAVIAGDRQRFDRAEEVEGDGGCSGRSCCCTCTGTYGDSFCAAGVAVLSAHTDSTRSGSARGGGASRGRGGRD